MFRIYEDNWKFKASKYLQNGNNALSIMVTDEEGNEVEPYCVCSVNPGKSISPDKIAVKDYSENSGMVEFLRAEGIIEGEPTETIPSGFVTIPVFRLTRKGGDLFAEEAA